MTIVPDFDPSTPSIARVYDYLLNGKDNFAADREVAERLMAVAPLAAEVTRENRQFLARAVARMASQGIRQLIDLGCGMPTRPNTHETARAIAPGARVAYVDSAGELRRAFGRPRRRRRGERGLRHLLLRGSAGVQPLGAGDSRINVTSSD